eukprot:SAG31_NODE_1439_length_8332_cov_11.389166_7_plen_179_part_00
MPTFRHRRCMCRVMQEQQRLSKLCKIHPSKCFIFRTTTLVMLVSQKSVCCSISRVLFTSFKTCRVLAVGMSALAPMLLGLPELDLLFIGVWTQYCPDTCAIAAIRIDLFLSGSNKFGDAGTLALAANAKKFEDHTGRKISVHIWGNVQPNVVPDTFVELQDTTLEVNGLRSTLPSFPH